MLNDFLELKVGISVKVVQICIDHLMTEHIVILTENERNRLINFFNVQCATYSVVDKTRSVETS